MSDTQSQVAPTTRLVDRRKVAAMLGCSVRHVERLEVDELIPPSFRIGSLVRWDRDIIEQWIVDSCPACPGWETDQ